MMFIFMSKIRKFDQVWLVGNTCADFSKKEYFLAHGRPKLVCVQFKGSQAQITIRNGHNSCKCMIKMIIIYDDCTINDRRPNQVKRRSAEPPLLCGALTDVSFVEGKRYTLKEYGCFLSRHKS